VNGYGCAALLVPLMIQEPVSNCAAFICSSVALQPHIILHASPVGARQPVHGDIRPACQPALPLSFANPLPCPQPHVNRDARPCTHSSAKCAGTAALRS